MTSPDKIENTKKIRFTREELRWIERTADIESAMAMNKFQSIINTIKIEKLTEEEKKMVQKISTELIELYTFLKELRVKLELWDCRFDVGSEFEVKLEDNGK
jgi:hypothetical protein